MKSGKNHYDFGGIAGNLVLIVVLPLIVYYLYFCLRFNDGRLFPAGIGERELLAFLRDIVPTGTAFLTYGIWIVFQALLQIVLPGKRVLGRELEGGRRLEYRMNGLLSFIVTLVVFWALIPTGVVKPLTVFGRVGSLISVTAIFAYSFSVFLYLYGKRTAPGKAPTASKVHNFFKGYSLNPRIRGFDLKLFFEARPSLVGWVILSLLYATVQHRTAGTVSTPMILVCLFQFVYVLDYFIHEEAILSTMDIVHDHF